MTTLNHIKITTPRSWSCIMYWWSFRLLNSWAGRVLFRAPTLNEKSGPQEWNLPSKKLTGMCKTEYWTSQGWDNVVIAPASETETTRVVLYLHGGSFIFPLNDIHWKTTSTLARKLDAQVIVVPYPLGPANTVYDVNAVIIKLYSDVLSRLDGREFIIAGDSSGGNIALCLAYAAAKQGLQLPEQLILFSPWVDLSISHPDVAKIQPYDSMIYPDHARLAAQAWLRGRLSNTELKIPLDDLRNPVVSPIFEDISILAKAGIKKLVVTSGTWDVTNPDIVLLVEKAVQAGIWTTFIEGRQQMHDFILFPTPEAREALDLVVAAVAR